MKQGGGEELYNELSEPYGSHLIGAATFPLESVPSTVPIESLEDFEGLKIRAPQAWSTTSSSASAPRRSTCRAPRSTPAWKRA